MKVEEVRPATALDIHRIAAEHAFANAEELRNEWKAESSRKAIERYEEALQHWRTAGEQLQEATSLRNIGEIYHVLGEPQRALTSTNRLSRSVRKPTTRKVKPKHSMALPMFFSTSAKSRKPWNTAVEPSI